MSLAKAPKTGHNDCTHHYSEDEIMNYNKNDNKNTNSSLYLTYIYKYSMCVTLIIISVVNNYNFERMTNGSTFFMNEFLKKHTPRHLYGVGEFGPITFCRPLQSGTVFLKNIEILSEYFDCSSLQKNVLFYATIFS